MNLDVANADNAQMRIGQEVRHLHAPADKIVRDVGAADVETVILAGSQLKLSR